MRIFKDLQVDFINRRKIGYMVSGTLLLLSVASFVFRGFELGIDFKGGTELVVETDQPVDVVSLREPLANELQTQVEVKTFGPDAILIRTAGAVDADALTNGVEKVIGELFPAANARVGKTFGVSPRFADDLKRGAIWSVVFSLLVIFLYVMLRFEWRFSVGAVAALFHDVVITLGLFSLLHNILPFSLQIDQTIIAAFLTIVGYSLNDTVVIFDRIREYSNIFKTKPYAEVVNTSINRTMSRTLVTSGTTLLVVLTLFIFGGEVLKGFAFALVIGILIGTYSSVFVASPVVVELRNRVPK